MTEQELENLMADKVEINPTYSVINFLDLRLLEEVVKEQMMFPSWKRANPERTRQLEDVLYRLKIVEQERNERCSRFAKKLARLRAEASTMPRYISRSSLPICTRQALQSK